MTAVPGIPQADAALAQVTFALADVPGLVGTPFMGAWLEPSAEMIPLFDRATYVDDDNAGYNLGDYPAGMFEGLHTLGMIWPLVESGFQIRDPAAMGLVYGFDRVRFTAPVHAGQRLRARGVVAEVRPRDVGYLMRLSVVVDIAGLERPAYTAEWWILYRPSGQLDLTPPEATLVGSGS